MLISFVPRWNETRAAKQAGRVLAKSTRMVSQDIFYLFAGSSLI